MGPRAGLENLSPTGIRSPDRPGRSKSLYRPVSPVASPNSSTCISAAQPSFLSENPHTAYNYFLSHPVYVTIHHIIRLHGPNINLLMPNDPYSGRTAPVTSKRCILYIYSTNIVTKYFKHGIYSPFFPLQNAVCFIILTYLVPVLFTFYIQDVLKLKNNSGAKRLRYNKERNNSFTTNYFQFTIHCYSLMRQNLKTTLQLSRFNTEQDSCQILL